jgi:hypothetical protein
MKKVVCTNYIFVVFLVYFTGIFSVSYAKYNNPVYSIPIGFLEAEVQLISFSDAYSKFRLKNSSIVNVRNDIHIRLVDDPYNIKPNEYFRIMAPMTAVKAISGDIDKNYIKIHQLSYYLNLRDGY